MLSKAGSGSNSGELQSGHGSGLLGHLSDNIDVKLQGQRRTTKLQPEIEEVSEDSKSSASTHSVHSSRVEIKSEEFQDHMVKHAKTLAEDELEQLLPQAKKKPDAEN